MPLQESILAEFQYQHTHVLRDWYELQKLKGLLPTADEVMTVVKTLFPDLTEAEQEYLYSRLP